MMAKAAARLRRPGAYGEEQGWQTDRNVRNHKSKEINHQDDTREAVEDLTRSNGDREPLNNLFWDDPHASGPWHAVVRIERILENGDRKTAGSGFVSDLLAESGSGRKLTVILTAAHVLCEGEGGSRSLVNGIAVCNAVDQVLVESHHSQRDPHCTYAVCAHYMEKTKFWDYGAIFLDLHPCYFPRPVVVPMDMYLKELDRTIDDNLCKAPSEDVQVTGYRVRLKDDMTSGDSTYPCEQLRCGPANLFCTSFSPTDKAAPLLFCMRDCDKGEFGGPVYQVRTGGHEDAHGQWQALGILAGHKPELEKDCEEIIQKKPIEGEPNQYARKQAFLKAMDHCKGSWGKYGHFAMALTSSVVEDILSWPTQREDLQLCYGNGA